MPVMPASVTVGATAGVTASLRDRYNTSNVTSLTSLAMVLYGPSGVGKSLTALTASEQYRVDAQGCPLPADLIDTVVFSYDKDGMVGALQFGITVDCVNVLDVMSEAGLNVMQFDTQILFPLMKEYYLAGKRNFIFDTLSARSEMLLAPVKAMIDNPANKLDFWTTTGGINTQFYLNTACHKNASVFYLGHSKYKEDTLSMSRNPQERAADDAKNKLKRESVDPFRSDITLQVPGNTGEVFIKQCSLLAALKLRIKPNGKGVERTLVIEPGSDVFRSKNRFAEVLDKEEPAHIRNMMTKYQKAIEAKLSQIGVTK